MELKHRRILYICFFIIFFITAPLVILWAEGYRYDFTKHQLRKVGVLFLESEPDKAEIYLNNKLQKPKTTTRLKNLLPNQYEVEIKKHGYQTWHKKLPVYSGQTTFAQYVRLFKENPEIKNILLENILLSSQEIDDVLTVIYQINSDSTPISGKNFTLALLNLNNYDLTELTDLTYLPDKITLSPDKSFVFLEYSPEYTRQKFVFDINREELNEIKQNINNLSWMPDSRDETMYGISKNGLEKVNLISQQVTTVLKKSVLNFYVADNDIFYLEKTKENILLKKISNNSDGFEIITTLPISDNYKFYNSPDNLLSLIDEKNSILYLIKTDNKNSETEDHIKIFPQTNYAKWLGNILLFGNDFEISTYDLEEDEKNLIVRLSIKIKKAIWYPVATHVVYFVDNTIKVIELANHQRNLHTLLEKPNIKDVFVNSKGDKIYFIDKSGISGIEIQ